MADFAGVHYEATIRHVRPKENPRPEETSRLLYLICPHVTCIPTHLGRVWWSAPRAAADHHDATVTFHCSQSSAAVQSVAHGVLVASK